LGNSLIVALELPIGDRMTETIRNAWNETDESISDEIVKAITTFQWPLIRNKSIFSYQPDWL